VYHRSLTYSLVHNWSHPTGRARFNSRVLECLRLKSCPRPATVLSPPCHSPAPALPQSCPPPATVLPPPCHSPAPALPQSCPRPTTVLPPPYHSPAPALPQSCPRPTRSCLCTATAFD